MGGSGVVLGGIRGALVWCSGDDVVQALNDVFDSDPDPSNPTSPYQVAKTASLALFQTAMTSGRWQDLLAAYVEAFDNADPPLPSGWGAYLQSLGTLSGIGGNIATTSSTAKTSAILRFGAGNVPPWMANGLNVSDSQGAITGGQKVKSFDTATVTLTKHVDAIVKSGDTIVFTLPAGQGPQNIQAIATARYQALTINQKMKTFKHSPNDPNSSGHVVLVTPKANEVWIDSPYIPPSVALRNRRGSRRYL